MCVGIPMQIVKIEGTNALARGSAREEMIDLSLIGECEAGDWVLTFLGAAREVISEEEAHKIKAALEALMRVNSGGEIGDAFADIEASGPKLPAHLEAARLAGKSFA